VYHTVWTGVDPSQPGGLADFTINFARTAYAVKGIKIYVDTNHNLNTWEEIDAVQLRGVLSPSDLVDGHFISAAFKNDEGDLDLDLYDASGNFLTRSATTGDGEKIDLAGLSAGVYYVRVSGKNGAT